MAERVRPRRRDPELSTLLKSPLLLTESAQDFAALREALEREIKPRGAIEQMYLADITYIQWEILRFRRSKTGIINIAIRNKMDCLQRSLNDSEGYDSEGSGEDADQASDGVGDEDQSAPAWFERADVKITSEVLAASNMNEVDVEAGAIEDVAASLELLDQMLSSLESRREKMLRNIEEYRFSFARQVRKSTDHIDRGSEILELGDATRKRRSAA